MYLTCNCLNNCFSLMHRSKVINAWFYSGALSRSSNGKLCKMSLKIIKIVLIIIFVSAELYAEKLISVATQTKRTEFLLQMITRINEVNNIELNILIQIDDVDEYECEFLSRSIGTPKLIVREANNTLQVKQNFNSEALIIAFVSNSNMFAVSKLLRRVMYRRPYIRLFYIYKPFVTAPDNVLLRHFVDCWRRGRVRVLALVNMTLLSYQRFPQPRIIRLAVEEAILFTRCHCNFHHFPLRFIDSRNIPRCVRYVDRNGDIRFAGYMYQLIEGFAEHCNASLLEIPIDYQMRTNFYVTLEKAINDGRVDFGTCGIPLKDVPLLSSFTIDMDVLILAPYGNRMKKYFFFTKPLPNWIYLAAVIIGLFASSLLALICLLFHKRDISASFLKVFALIIQAPTPLIERSSVMLPLLIVIDIFGFLITITYTARQSVAFTLGLFEPLISNINDIEQTNLTVLASIFDFELLNDLPSIITERLTIVEERTMVQQLHHLNTSNIYIGLADKLFIYTTQQKNMKLPLFLFLHQTLPKVPTQFALGNESPFMLHFHNFITHFLEAGLMKKLEYEMLRRFYESGALTLFKDNAPDNITFDADYIYIPIMMLYTGLALSAIVFIIENLWFRFGRR